jgi:hypothetical protein
MKTSKQNLKSAGRGITLKSISKGLEPFHKYINGHTKPYRAYQQSLAKFVFWWNDHLIDHKDEFVTSLLKYKGKKVVCTRIHIKPSMFICTVDIRPMYSNQDIGSGAGVTKTLTF